MTFFIIVEKGLKKYFDFERIYSENNWGNETPKTCIEDSQPVMCKNVDFWLMSFT